MPAFSFTAPHVTPEQEREERENLSDARRREIHNDLFGFEQQQHRHAGKEVPEVSDSALDGIYEAIEKLPLQQKIEYLEARKHAPKLCQTESDPIMFLRCEKFDYEAAATRLVYYWKIRRKLFGEHRAYLPMTLSGALADDKTLFETGILAFHPDDERGRNVLFLDRVRATPPLASREGTMRCLFFMVHILTFRETPIQTEGGVCLVNIKGYDIYKHFDRLLSKFTSIILLHCMPIKFKALHLLVGSANGVMSLVLPSMKQVMGKECRLRMVVHSGLDGKMVDTLRPYGLAKRNLSENLSGDVKYAEFVSWLDSWRERSNEERRGSTTSTAADDDDSSDNELLSPLKAIVSLSSD